MRLLALSALLFLSSISAESNVPASKLPIVRQQKSKAPLPEAPAQERAGGHGGVHGGGLGGGHVGVHGGGHGSGHGGKSGGGGHGHSVVNHIGGGGHHGISAPHGGGGISSSYGAPQAASSSYDPGHTSTGYYYYYYPVTMKHEGGGKKGGFLGGSGGKRKGMFSRIMDTIMYPVMYPLRRMSNYFSSRSLDTNQEYFKISDKILTKIEEEILTDECISQMICQLGKQAESYKEIVQLSEFFVSQEYKDFYTPLEKGTNKKFNCKIEYKCTSFE